MSRKTILTIFSIIILFSYGCSSVISEHVRKQVDKNLTFETVLQNPDANKGKMVIWGGVIVKTKNLKNGTQIEVLQTYSDRNGAPINNDISKGRFLGLYDGYLDSEIYKKGREVTVAGVVDGKKTLAIGETDYVYPVISIKEVHLWEKGINAYTYPNYGMYPRYRGRWSYWRYPYWGWY